MTEKLYTPYEASQKLRISIRTLRNLREKSGFIRYGRKQIYYTDEHLQRIIDLMEIKPQDLEVSQSLDV